MKIYYCLLLISSLYSLRFSAFSGIWLIDYLKFSPSSLLIASYLCETDEIYEISGISLLGGESSKGNESIGRNTCSFAPFGLPSKEFSYLADTWWADSNSYRLLTSTQASSLFSASSAKIFFMGSFSLIMMISGWNIYSLKSCFGCSISIID